MKDRKIEITVETYEVLVISRHASLKQGWCSSCGKQVTIVNLNAACSLTEGTDKSLDQESSRADADLALKGG